MEIRRPPQQHPRLHRPQRIRPAPRRCLRSPRRHRQVALFGVRELAPTFPSVVVIPTKALNPVTSYFDFRISSFPFPELNAPPPSFTPTTPFQIASELKLTLLRLLPWPSSKKNSAPGSPSLASLELPGSVSTLFSFYTPSPAALASSFSTMPICSSTKSATSSLV